MKREQFQQIFRSSFDDSDERCRWFFDKVANDPSQIYIAPDSHGRAASALLMQPYDFLYEGHLLPSAYISCVATLPEARSKGLASTLLKDSLRAARANGTVLCELIPAEDHLYFFYDRLGFATVFYADRERYSSAHTFKDASGALTDPSYEIFHGLEMRRGCGVLHTRTDYDNILADMALDGGNTLLAATDGNGAYAMLFATDNGNEKSVRCLMSDNEGLASTVLAELRRRAGARPFTVLRPPMSGSHAFLKARGMLRITDPLPLLSVLGEVHPGLRLSIRLTDSELPENNGVYSIADGSCRRSPYVEKGHFDLAIDTPVLASILFSSHDMGRIFGIPARRPYMALMLD